MCVAPVFIAGRQFTDHRSGGRIFTDCGVTDLQRNRSVVGILNVNRNRFNIRGTGCIGGFNEQRLCGTGFVVQRMPVSYNDRVVLDCEVRVFDLLAALVDD